MTQQPHIDPERLAALLDGRLSGAEAAAVRAQLADADDDTLSAFADAIAVSGEIGAGSEPRIHVVKPPQRHWRWIVPSIALAAAAAFVIIVVRPNRASREFEPYMLAAAVPAGASMAGGSVWGATRGAGDRLSDRARAVRVGALLIDLEIGALRGDPTQAPAADIVGLMKEFPGGGAIARPLLDSTITPERRHQVAQDIMRTADNTLASAGAYLEAARLATTAGEVSFFDRFPATTLSSLENDARIDDSARAQLQQLNALVNAKPRDAEQIRPALDALLRAFTQ